MKKPQREKDHRARRRNIPLATAPSSRVDAMVSEALFGKVVPPRRKATRLLDSGGSLFPTIQALSNGQASQFFLVADLTPRRISLRSIL